MSIGNVVRSGIKANVYILDNSRPPILHQELRLYTILIFHHSILLNQPLVLLFTHLTSTTSKMSERLPPYMQNAAYYPDNKPTQYSHTTNATPQLQQRFPPQFGIYHAPGSHTDLIIALQKDAPSLFHISTHGAWSRQPDVVLHSTPSSESLPLATAQFSKFSSTTDIMICPSNHLAQPIRTQLTKDQLFSSSMSFFAATAQSGTAERFEWKSSTGPEVQALEGSRHGMSLVRTQTGEVVAAWARPNSGTKKKGKVAWVGRRDVLGEGGEVLAIVTILAIMEKTRRRQSGTVGVAAGGTSVC